MLITTILAIVAYLGAGLAWFARESRKPVLFQPTRSRSWLMLVVWPIRAVVAFREARARGLSPSRYIATCPGPGSDRCERASFGSLEEATDWAVRKARQHKADAFVTDTATFVPSKVQTGQSVPLTARISWEDGSTTLLPG
jgi:hypothetical protein